MYAVRANKQTTNHKLTPRDVCLLQFIIRKEFIICQNDYHSNTDEEFLKYFIRGIEKMNASGLKCSISGPQTVSPAVSNKALPCRTGNGQTR